MENVSKVALKNGEVLIDLTGDDVKPEHVQEGIIFHDKSGTEQTGTNTKTVDASGANVTAAEMLTGRKAGVGDKIITGTMPDNSGNNVEISNLAGTNVPLGYSDGTGKAKVSSTEAAKIIPGNIKEGVSILGVEGTFGADDISSESKTVTPSFEDQTVLPSTGVAYLSSVLVKGIPVTRVNNDAGGVTVTIG